MQMETQKDDPVTRWRNAFIYALVTTIMVLGAATVMGRANQELAERVDKNAAVAVTGTDAIICILQLGVGVNAPPRNNQNVVACLKDSGYVDIPTVPLEP